MIRAVKAWWARLSPAVRAQVARFARVAALAILPQLLAAAADPHGLTLKLVGAAVTAGLEAGWRAVMPPPEATNAALPAPADAPTPSPASVTAAKPRTKAKPPR